MTKVITYGTYDLLHAGHLRLLERAKALGDYLIVGVTSDDFDKSRGKINNQQSLIERIDAIKETGLADEIIVEEYEGQKIDDIKRYCIDIFTVGSDWSGQFDYLEEYCKVVYLDRTKGVSSSDIRAHNRELRIFCFDKTSFEKKFISECLFVNGVISTNNREDADAYHLYSTPSSHYETARRLILEGKHVFCESPISLNSTQCKELFDLAKQNGVFLFDGIKTAYSTAFSRMLLLVKSGKIGDVISIDATCTSMAHSTIHVGEESEWNSICSWGPIALLPVFLILGTDYVSKSIVTRLYNRETMFDSFTKIEFVYDAAVASIKVAKRAKSEGELIITGTKGYIYVPAPWWKMDYFEVRYENPQDNKRYFYQLDGDGIRNEIASFAKSISAMRDYSAIPSEVSIAITKVIEDFYEGDYREI